MALSLPTLRLLQTVLHAQQLNGQAPDFEETARAVLRAREELARAIAEAEGSPPKA